MTDLGPTKKKRGRPATGQGKPVGLRLHDDILRAIDDWRRDQPQALSVGAAVRELAKIGLQHDRRQRQMRAGM